MTTGSVAKHLLVFSVPLLLGNLIQQLYNTVDTWVVGNYVGNAAFSAVGTLNPALNLLIGFFSGFASGAGVIISQYYGAGRHDKVHDAVHSSIFLSIVLSIALSVTGVLITPALVRFMNTPADVVPESTAYLSIYFAGLSGLLFYNMGAGILRAVGDSRRPFIYLAVSAVTNIILDLIFVIRFHMGVRGVAYATIIAQFISAGMTLAALLRTEDSVRVKPAEVRYDSIMLRRIVAMGVPTAIQISITSFSNTFVQAYINRFGTDCMGGWTAYSKLNQFIFTPLQSMGVAIMTFVGQNIGAGQRERARKGVRTALLISVAITVAAGGLQILYAPQATAFLNRKAEVVAYGTMFIRYYTGWCLFACLTQVLSGAIRGMGNTRIPMIAMLGSYVVFRQVYLFVFSHYISDTPLALGFGYPAGWVLCAAVHTVAYYRLFAEIKEGAASRPSSRKESEVSHT